MATPTLQVIVTGATSLTYIANDGFETNTTGWSVSAGINAAATSITRTATAPYMGAWMGRLVTTATNGSGVKYVLTGTFSTGNTYRFSVYLKSVSGTTSGKILIGSLGTAGDRANSTFTLTTSWVRYSVDWSPSSDRTDAQVNITNNAASAMTVDIDDAEVIESSADRTSITDHLVITRGFNFEGGLAAGSGTLHLKNIAKALSTGNAQLRAGNKVYIRATYGGIAYGLIYGLVTRVVWNVDETVDVFFDEISAAWSSVDEVNIAASMTRSLSTFRGLILDAMGLTATQRNLATSEAEADIPLTGADQASAVSLLAAIDHSTATVSYLVPDPSPSVLYVYTTLPRMARSTQATDETVGDQYTAIALSVDGEHDVTTQRVTMTGRTLAPGTLVWTSDEVPFTVAAGETRTIWATFSAPTIGAALTTVGTVTPTFTPFSGSAKIVVGPGTITAMTVSGSAAVAQSGTSAFYDSAVTPIRSGQPYDAEYLPSVAAAAGLAEFIVRQSASFDRNGRPRGDVTMTNAFPTIVARQLGDRVNVSPLAVYVAYDATIETITTEVDMGAAEWQVTWRLGPDGVTNLGTFFVLGTSALGGAHILGI